MAATAREEGDNLSKNFSEQVLDETESEIPEDFEPGASKDAVILPAGPFEDDESSVEYRLEYGRKSSCISEIQIERSASGEESEQCGIVEAQESTDRNTEKELKEARDELPNVAEEEKGDSNQKTEIPEINEEDEEEVTSIEWKKHKKHVFVLSEAGKPIYSRFGSEDKLVTLMGVMQALVSFVQQSGDAIHSLHAGDHKFVFLKTFPFILVCVATVKASVPQLVDQLKYVFLQIISVLTFTNLKAIFEQRRNYDLRRLLGGAEKFLDNLVDVMDNDPSFLLNAVRCLPLESSVRDTIGQTLSQYCGKIKNVVFAILLAEKQLVTLVRMKKYCLQPEDLHLVMNLVSSSECFKSAESWIPICLPKFDSSGFLHGHISYLDENNVTCLLLLTVDKDMFFPLQKCRGEIVERLKRHHCLEAISKSLNDQGYSAVEVGIPDLRHFLYKSRSTARFTSPRIEPPYMASSSWEHLFGLYQYLHHRMYSVTPQLKMLFYSGNTETMMGWRTSGFELYAAFEPLTTKLDTINAMRRIVHWIKKEEDHLFIMNSPTI